MEVFSNEYALLAMQSALLREVTPALRAATLDLDKDEEILHVHFYYDGEASEQRIDLWDCVIFEAGADLDFVESQIKRLDYPQKIPLSGYCAYLRKEHDVPTREGCPKVKIAEVSIGYALLTIQHALLGVVTPELRAVVVDFTKEESLLYVRFYYDGEVPEQLIDLWQSAIQEAKEDLGSHCLLDGGVERADYPNTFPFRGRYAYFRKE
jgi:hypothetical protein